MSTALQKFAALAVLTATISTASAGRFEDLTARYKDPANPAQPLSATFLGSSGTDWLSDAVFLADGSVVFVGNTLGPELTVAGKTPAIVGGKDSAAPAPEADPQPTGFLVHLSPDLQEVKATARLPWQSANLNSVTAAPDGTVYVTGFGGGEFAVLSADTKPLETEDIVMEVPGKGDTKKPLQKRLLFVARLSRDLATVEWIRWFEAPCNDPVVEWEPEGRLLWLGADLREIDPDGKTIHRAPILGGNSDKIAVNLAARELAYGHEKHWPTGREPWRCPVLQIREFDGRIKLELYSWPGPLVGIDGLRLVSDSAIRDMAYDAEGNLVLSGWSDGGNSVFGREPYDVFTPARIEGLGFSSWGATVQGLAHILKLDRESYKVLTGGLWCSFTAGEKGKPNTANINKLALGPDGSIVIAGASAWGLIQTGNNLNGSAPPGGPYIAIFNKDFSEIRFSSVMAGTGVRKGVTPGRQWNIVGGTVNGQPRVLVMGSAAASGTHYTEEPRPTVTLNPVQPNFGGGETDGWAILFDLQ